MRHASLGIAGAIVAGIGLAGILTTLLLGGTNRLEVADRGVGRLSGTDASLGARIFLDGIGEDGVIPRSAVGPGMMGGGCVTCHGADGRGDSFSMMMGNFEAPDITYDALTSPHEESGNDEGAWDDADILRAISEGLEPSGDRLDPIMPRWELTEREFDALLDYLKELSDS